MLSSALFHCLWNGRVTREILCTFQHGKCLLAFPRVFPILWTFRDRDGLFNRTKIICSTKYAILGRSSHSVSSRSRTGLSKKNAPLTACIVKDCKPFALSVYTFVRSTTRVVEYRRYLGKNRYIYNDFACSLDGLILEFFEFMIKWSRKKGK